MQNRKCRKVAKQLGSRIPPEQCKDVSTRKYSTTHETVEDSFSSATIPSSWPAERPVFTSQTVSSDTPVSQASPASGLASSMTITQHKHGPQQVIGIHTYSEITDEDLHSATVMQLSPVVTNGNTADLLEKKYATRPRQAKEENVTTQSSKEDSFGEKVIKETLALSPKNDGYMMTISNMRMDGTEEKTILTKEKSKMPYDEKSSEMSPPWG